MAGFPSTKQVHALSDQRRLSRSASSGELLCEAQTSRRSASRMCSAMYGMCSGFACVTLQGFMPLLLAPKAEMRYFQGKERPMPADSPVRSVVKHLGLLFDVAGLYPAHVRDFVIKNRIRRTRSVEEALKSDMEAIAGDMRRAIDKWASEHE
jgi:hypothetical protein